MDRARRLPNLDPVATAAVTFDRCPTSSTRAGLSSIAPRAVACRGVLGIAGALHAAKALHVLMITPASALVHSLHLGRWPGGRRRHPNPAGLEHSLVKPSDLSRVNAAFFTMNGYVSVLFFLFWAADIFLLKPGA